MAQHTPGPWLNKHYDQHQQIIIGSASFRGPNELAKVQVPLTLTEENLFTCTPADVAECEANARLIAAAPELLNVLIELACLKRLHDRIESYDFANTEEIANATLDYDKRKPAAWAAARAVITKINGA